MRYEIASFHYPGNGGELPRGWEPIAYHGAQIIARRRLRFWERSRPTLAVWH